MELTAHIRRLSTQGSHLYVRLDPHDLDRLGLGHGQLVTLDIAARVQVRGIVKTSGGSPWLAPRTNESNALITTALREAGFEHGEDASAGVSLAGGTD